MTPPASNFIREIIERDLEAGTHEGRVATRFPPEPNGYLHIGHAKSICLNFGLARDYQGVCHLRFDDTNPLTESTEYVESIQRDIRWLGHDWGEHLYFASDYFEALYQFAEELIRAGKAYVCSLSEEQVKEYRGKVGQPGRPSPDRDRPMADNLELFRRMRKGEFKDGELVLRAKISLDSPNMKMRDPAIYRIRHAHHHRTGNQWCIYPLYDFTHCLSDSIEHITHSICTLEFENNRELYDWILENVSAPYRSRQYEFAALNLTYTVTSKRKLRELVESSLVSGWDDPRLPTLSGLRRRGYPPEAIRTFCERVGVAKNNSTVDVGLLEFTVREQLNAQTKRVLCVQRPLDVVITTLPEHHVESMDAPYFPDDASRSETRPLPLSRRIVIEQTDFQEHPSPGFKRLSKGGEVRLRHSYVIRCDEVVKDADGRVVELRCSHDPNTANGPAPSGKRTGTIHWLSREHALPCEIRLYDRLFNAENPSPSEGPDFKTFLNPRSLEVVRSLVEPSVATDPGDTRYQFERVGFFWRDPVDSKPDRLVFNRIVSLKDSWAKLVETQELGASLEKQKQAERRRDRDAQKQAQQQQDRGREVALGGRAAELAREHSLAAELARGLAKNPGLDATFVASVELGADPKGAATLLLGDVARELKNHPDFVISPERVAELCRLVAAGSVTGRAVKEIVAELRKNDRDVETIVAELGVQRVADEAALVSEIDRVLADFAPKVDAYRAGNHNLMGLFVGQVMQRTRGGADPVLVERLLREKLG